MHARLNTVKDFSLIGATRLFAELDHWTVSSWMIAVVPQKLSFNLMCIQKSDLTVTIEFQGIKLHFLI